MVCQFVKNGPTPLVVKSPPKPLNVPGYVTPTPPTPKPTATPVPKATTKAATQPAATPAFKYIAGLSEPLIKPSDVPELTLKEYMFDSNKNSYPAAGTPVVMQVLVWQDAADKQALFVEASPDPEIGQLLDGELQNCENYYAGQGSPISCGPANFGEKSLYWDVPSNTIPAYQESDVMFKKGDYYVILRVSMNDKDKSHSEASRLAGLALSRMN